MVRRRILPVMLIGLFLFLLFPPTGVNRAGADITFDQIRSTAGAMAKLRNLTRTQALQAIDIAQSVVNNVGDAENSWLDNSEMSKLYDKGLTKRDVNEALDSIKKAVEGSNWENLTSTDSYTQLTAAVDLANQVIIGLSATFRNNLSSCGIEVNDLVTASLELVNIQISSWEGLPADAINSIFDNYAAKPGISRETAASYGLNWNNLQEILDILTASGQKEQLRGILISLGNWKTPSGGGGGGGSGPTPSSGTVSDSTLNNAIQESSTTGMVTLQAGPSETKLALTNNQIEKTLELNKPLEVIIGGVNFNLTPEALKAAGLNMDNVSSIAFSAQKVSASTAAELAAAAAGGTLYSIAGEIYQLSITALMKDNTQQAISQLNGMVTVALPVPEGARGTAENGYLLAGRYNQNTGTWDEVPGNYDQNSGTFNFSTNRLSYWALMQKKVKTFTDIKGHWAQRDIEYLATYGYISGMGDGLFAPESPVTRAQFTTMLAGALKLTGNAGAPFTDVPAGEWYYKSIGQAYSAGIVKGISPDRFEPEELITREQMAVMICNALQHKGLLDQVKGAEGVLGGFSDSSSISDWARASAALAVKHSILKGRAFDGSVVFAPLDPATRAEAAVILRNIIRQ